MLQQTVSPSLYGSPLVFTKTPWLALFLFCKGSLSCCSADLVFPANCFVAI